MRFSFEATGSAMHLSTSSLLLACPEGLKRLRTRESADPVTVIQKVDSPQATRGQIIVPSSSGTLWIADCE